MRPRVQPTDSGSLKVSLGHINLGAITKTVSGEWAWSCVGFFKSTGVAPSREQAVAAVLERMID